MTILIDCFSSAKMRPDKKKNRHHDSQKCANKAKAKAKLAATEAKTENKVKRAQNIF